MILLWLPITIVVYLAFPFFYYLGNGKIPEKKAKKYSLINCIICASFFIILRIATGSDAIGAGGFAPAVLYYFIGKAILAEKTENIADKQDNYANQKNKQLKNQQVINQNISKEKEKIMVTPKENLIKMEQDTAFSHIKILMPERKGYGYEKENPIEVPTPDAQWNFIYNVIPSHKGITDVRLAQEVRIDSIEASGRQGLVDKYEVMYIYIKDEIQHAELFEIYFSFYPKENENQNDFLFRVMTTKPEIPEGLIEKN